MFGDPNEVATAERRIRSLCMAEHHHASRYVTDFRRYSALIAWNDAALISQFRAGLPDRILDELARRDDPIADLAELQRVVLRLDARYWERRDERTRQEGTTRIYSPGSHTLRDRHPPAAKPRTFPPGPRPAGLTPEEHMRRIRAGLCLFCGGAGHRAAACLKRGRADSRPPGRTPGRFGATQDAAITLTDAAASESDTQTAKDDAEPTSESAWATENDPATQ